jgi:hypothetical protein
MGLVDVTLVFSMLENYIIEEQWTNLNWPNICGANCGKRHKPFLPYTFKDNLYIF